MISSAWPCESGTGWKWELITPDGNVLRAGREHSQDAAWWAGRLASFEANIAGSDIGDLARLPRVSFGGRWGR